MLQGLFPAKGGSEDITGWFNRSSNAGDWIITSVINLTPQPLFVLLQTEKQLLKDLWSQWKIFISKKWVSLDGEITAVIHQRRKLFISLERFIDQTKHKGWWEEEGGGLQGLTALLIFSGV